MEMLQSANLAARFLLEVCVLAAVGYWGFQTGPNQLARWGLGIGAPLMVAVLWGVFGSPNAAVPLGGLPHVLLELVIFGSGFLALLATGHVALAGLFGIAVVVNRVLMQMWGQ